jgi:hypothetical protein
MEQKTAAKTVVQQQDRQLPKRERETKDEKKERILGIAKDAIDSLSRKLDAGKSETLVHFLSTMANFHQYSFGNVMLIAAQCPEATQVAGFNTWKKVGRSVIKGERGIGIMAPVVYKKKSNDEDLPTDDEKSSDRRVSGFRVVHVFDVSQTEGDALPKFAQIQGSPGDKTDQLRKLIESNNIQVKVENISGGAKGLSTGGTIIIQAGLSPAEEFAVMAHEFAHELLHKSERRAETTKTIRETEAEAVAFVVCKSCGIDTSTRSSDYIQIYQGDTQILQRSLDAIQKTAAHIIDEIPNN